jgi:hypothetical protein
METAGNIAEQAQYQALRLEDGFQRVLRESPLAVGAVTLALGTAVGLALPQTARENQLMGEARDSLLERAQDFAQETVERSRGSPPRSPRRSPRRQDRGEEAGPGRQYHKESSKIVLIAIIGASQLHHESTQ